MKEYKVAVIGGGASGIICAIELVKGGKIKPEDIVLIERNERIGKKLLATGNGQGNLTNRNISSSFYHGNKEFIDNFIEKYKSIDLIAYFKDLGIVLDQGEDGKMYPVSYQASAVLDILRAHLDHYGIEVLTLNKVEKIVKDKCYILYSNGNKIKAERVIFACGGKSGKQFGTDGSAYSLLEPFNHKTTSLYPSLVQLKTEREKIKGLKNLKEKAKVSLYSNGELIKSATGDLLFTDYGVSGNAVFNVSSAVGGRENLTLKIEFLPKFSKDEIAKIIEDRKNVPFIYKEGELVGLINKKIGQTVLRSVKDKTPENIASAVKNFTLKVEGTLGFDYSQVTKGGIITDGIKDNFESKYSDGLYIVGEALNVDGDCGGYNLTFAFVSGIVCARDIKSKFR